MSSAIKDVFDGAHEKIGVSTLLPEDAAALLGVCRFLCLARVYG